MNSITTDNEAFRPTFSFGFPISSEQHTPSFSFNFTEKKDQIVPPTNVFPFSQPQTESKEKKIIYPNFSFTTYVPAEQNSRYSSSFGQIFAPKPMAKTDSVPTHSPKSDSVPIPSIKTDSVPIPSPKSTFAFQYPFTEENVKSKTDFCPKSSSGPNIKPSTKPNIKPSTKPNIKPSAKPRYIVKKKPHTNETLKNIITKKYTDKKIEDFKVFILTIVPELVDHVKILKFKSLVEELGYSDCINVKFNVNGEQMDLIKYLIQKKLYKFATYLIKNKYCEDCSSILKFVKYLAKNYQIDASNSIKIVETIYSLDYEIKKQITMSKKRKVDC
jgi:hypothetical protein